MENGPITTDSRNGNDWVGKVNKRSTITIRGGSSSSSTPAAYRPPPLPEPEQDDTYNYALLILLYTLQGIPIGLSASIPFLIQQKISTIAAQTAAAAAASTTVSATASTLSSDSVSKVVYNAQAIFSLASWPFSMKLLWAPIVDACFVKKWGRRKSWLVPVQLVAGLLMIFGSYYVEDQLGLEPTIQQQQQQQLQNFDAFGVTLFFVALYFLMATQDIAVDGWALTMLSKKNRGKGPICNSIGQNIGFFLSFVGFLALNDAESCEKLWRPLFGIASKPGKGIISLGGFIRTMGCFMLLVTTFVAFFKREVNPSSATTATDDDDAELDASQLGIRETYSRLWAVCQLPAVRTLFVILLTCRFPTAVSDRVKTLKAVEFGLSKQTIALLAPTIILPLGIVVPIVASKIWKGKPLGQFMTAYKLRVTLVPILDVLMLFAIKNLQGQTDLSSITLFWISIVSSTALFSIVDSMQFNSQMTFFAQRVDPSIGGTYMTLLNTAANLGGTWPAPVIMYLVGQFTIEPKCTMNGDVEICSGGRDAYFPLQLILSILGICWIWLMGPKVNKLEMASPEAWLTKIGDYEDKEKGRRPLSYNKKI